MKHKGLILLIVLSAVVFLVFLSQQNGGPKPAGVAVGLRVPDFVLLDKDGKEIRLSQLKGKTVFVHFWASWCKECRAEMPSIYNLYKRKSSDPNFVFLSVIYKEDPADSSKYLKENNYNIPVYIDPNGNAAEIFRVTGVPETYIINPEGILTKKVIGPGRWEEF